MDWEEKQGKNKKWEGTVFRQHEQGLESGCTGIPCLRFAGFGWVSLLQPKESIQPPPVNIANGVRRSFPSPFYHR